jgi:alkylation response protein AidB-like acyl-CoA dehydrogenase
LTNERSSYAAGADYGMGAYPGPKGGMLDLSLRAVLDQVAGEGDGRRAFPLGSPAAMIDLAGEFGHRDDPIIRQRIARLYCLTETARVTAARAKAAAAAGRPPGPESSLGYVAGVLVARLSRDLGLDILGAHGMLSGADAPRDGAVAHMALSSLVHGIQGGSEQIQRNILGERVLGLPREPQVDRDVPFRDLLVGTQRR